MDARLCHPAQVEDFVEVISQSKLQSNWFVRLERAWRATNMRKCETVASIRVMIVAERVVLVVVPLIDA
ncbi:MAG TPA: hypothetical protein VGR15_07130 [Bacteroidota bacterium]|nr:hypothetical protein [Bacteroidota bacterium]